MLEFKYFRNIVSLFPYFFFYKRAFHKQRTRYYACRINAVQFDLKGTVPSTETSRIIQAKRDSFINSFFIYCYFYYGVATWHVSLPEGADKPVNDIKTAHLGFNVQSNSGNPGWWLKRHAELIRVILGLPQIYHTIVMIIKIHSEMTVLGFDSV